VLVIVPQILGVLQVVVQVLHIVQIVMEVVGSLVLILIHLVVVEEIDTIKENCSGVNTPIPKMQIAYKEPMASASS